MSTQKEKLSRSEQFMNRMKEEFVKREITVGLIIGSRESDKKLILVMPTEADGTMNLMDTFDTLIEALGQVSKMIKDTGPQINRGEYLYGGNDN